MKLSDLYKVCKPFFDRTMVVKTTADQLRSNRTDTIKVMSWGACHFRNFDDMGLIFEVSGRKHKGYVLITLDWTDTYNVYLISYSGVIKKEMKGVYCDELTERIDESIEKIPDYQF